MIDNRYAGSTVLIIADGYTDTGEAIIDSEGYYVVNTNKELVEPTDLITRSHNYKTIIRFGLHITFNDLVANEVNGYYSAVKGTTLEDWIDSEYNTSGVLKEQLLNDSIKIELVDKAGNIVETLYYSDIINGNKTIPLHNNYMYRLSNKENSGGDDA